ncbi:MAG: DUF4365 domain-containing protein [Polyangiaceae bacterium]|nr:DUF4365 domain-containing protein [Polyangiaceae bacterium]
MDTRPQEGFGVHLVANTVEFSWRSGWQELDRRNDDVTDGLILMRRKGRDTGDLLFVQIKSGTEYRRDSAKRPNHISIHVGAEYIQSHRPRWNAVPGPMVLVYVDPSKRSSPDTFWVDLRNPNSFSLENKQLILIPKHQRFGAHSKGDFFALCRKASTDRALPILKVSRDDVNYVALSATIKRAAEKYYHAWQLGPQRARTSPALGVIDISRVGWRHLTRRDRKVERIIASWGLLGVAKRIVQECSELFRIGRSKIRSDENGSKHILDFIGLRARIVFPHRGDAIVQVVIRRKRSVYADGRATTRHWFYSVYELRRGDIRSL